MAPPQQLVQGLKNKIKSDVNTVITVITSSFQGALLLEDFFYYYYTDDVYDEL